MTVKAPIGLASSDCVFQVPQSFIRCSKSQAFLFYLQRKRPKARKHRVKVRQVGPNIGNGTGRGDAFGLDLQD